jgi:hypothetical protein
VAFSASAAARPMSLLLTRAASSSPLRIDLACAAASAALSVPWSTAWMISRVASSALAT